MNDKFIKQLEKYIKHEKCINTKDNNYRFNYLAGWRWQEFKQNGEGKWMASEDFLCLNTTPLDIKYSKEVVCDYFQNSCKV